MLQARLAAGEATGFEGLRASRLHRASSSAAPMRRQCGVRCRWQVKAADPAAEARQFLFLFFDLRGLPFGIGFCFHGSSPNVRYAGARRWRELFGGSLPGPGNKGDAVQSGHLLQLRLTHAGVWPAFA